MTSKKEEPMVRERNDTNKIDLSLKNQPRPRREKLLAGLCDTRRELLAAAIKIYAAQSPFACPFACPEENRPRVINGAIDPMWEDAADTLALHYIVDHPMNFDTFVSRFGECVTLAVFWNHVTAIFSDIIGNSSLDGVDPMNPVFQLLIKH